MGTQIQAVEPSLTLFTWFTIGINTRIIEPDPPPFFFKSKLGLELGYIHPYGGREQGEIYFHAIPW